MNQKELKLVNDVFKLYNLYGDLFSIAFEADTKAACKLRNRIMCEFHGIIRSYSGPSGEAYFNRLVADYSKRLLEDIEKKGEELGVL